MVHNHALLTCSAMLCVLALGTVGTLSCAFPVTWPKWLIAYLGKQLFLGHNHGDYSVTDIQAWKE